MEKRASRTYQKLAIASVLAMVTAIPLTARVALAASASEIERNATEALRTLYANTPGALELATRAEAQTPPIPWCIPPASGQSAT